MRKRVRRISCVFEKKKDGRRTYQGRYRDKASPSFRRDCDKGDVGTSSSSDGTATGGPCGTVTMRVGNSSSSDGTSSSGGTATEGPFGAVTSSSSGGGTVVLGYDNETSSSTTHMCFVLGTSSSLSLTCAMPNSSFIVSNVLCKNYNIPK
jgi:hypothetical protein